MTRRAERIDCVACGGQGYGVGPGPCPVCQGTGTIINSPLARITQQHKRSPQPAVTVIRYVDFDEEYPVMVLTKTPDPHVKRRTLQVPVALAARYEAVRAEWKIVRTALTQLWESQHPGETP